MWILKRYISYHRDTFSGKLRLWSLEVGILNTFPDWNPSKKPALLKEDN